jgi:hypothetical protein
MAVQVFALVPYNKVCRSHHCLHFHLRDPSGCPGGSCKSSPVLGGTVTSGSWVVQHGMAPPHQARLVSVHYNDALIVFNRWLRVVPCSNSRRKGGIGPLGPQSICFMFRLGEPCTGVYPYGVVMDKLDSPIFRLSCLWDVCCQSDIVFPAIDIGFRMGVH